MAERTLRVLHLHHTAMFGGAEASLLCLLRHLPPEVQSVLACPEGGFVDQAGAAGRAEVRAVPAWDARWDLSPWGVFREYQGLRALRHSLRLLVREFGPSLVHANSRPAAVAAVRGGAAGLPVVWHVRDLRMRGVVVRWLLHRCAAVIAISRSVERLLIAAGCPRERLYQVYNGVDLSELRPERPAEEVRQELGVPRDAPMVVAVARLVPWKRYDLLLAAAHAVRAREPEVRFVFVGGESPQDKGYRARLENEARRLGVEGTVQFAGHRTDVASVMAATDVFVHAADAEPLGRAVMEAMALGKPVVVPNSAGPGELVEDGVSGLAVAPGSAEALADGVLRMLTDPAFAAACGERARERVATHFNADKMARETVAVFRQVAEGGPR